MSDITQAIENDSIVKMKSLIENGIDLSKPILIGEEYDLDDYDEISPLFYSIRKYASIEMLELFIESGIDLHETDLDGISALDIAIKFKRKDVIQFCIDREMDLNCTKRKSGILPLMLASCFSDVGTVELLLKHGAKINAIDKSGMSAKDYAKKLGQKNVVLFLDGKGAKFNAYSNEE